MAKVADSSVAAIAMAIVGRSARACDVCATKGAHWFCAADDAYLCTVCDTQVHSANALSLRHERVRLTSNGTKGDGCKVSGVKKAHPRPAQVASVRKRSRTARPYSHHLKKLTQVVKAEEPGVVKAELELFDFLDADEFLVADAGNQEVPNLVESSSSDFDLLSSDYEHSASADSFAAFFKGKAAAQSQGEVDEFLVPDKRFESSSQDDAFFFPGDIPGLDSFVPEMDLSSDDFSLSFDLALQNHDTSSGMVETFEGELTAQPQDAVASPFAKWFATKREAEDVDEEPLSPERIKRDAMAMLKCCEGEASVVPSLQLNFQEVLTAWSGRGEPWIVHPVSSPTTSSDAGLGPDLACGGDESQSSGDRDARVLRYKEKRRTRLFSKKIRYEVRKLNAERRPRMKGRFVKRSSLTCTAAAAS